MSVLRRKVIALLGIVAPWHMMAFVPRDLFLEVSFQSCSLCNPCESILSEKVVKAERPSLAAVGLLRFV